MKQSKRDVITNAIKSLGFTVYTNREHAICTVSAEHGDMAADYWGEHPQTDPMWINPKLESLADAFECFWEWESPGAINLYMVD